jgi:hypothetical protein
LEDVEKERRVLARSITCTHVTFMHMRTDYRREGLAGQSA